MRDEFTALRRGYWLALDGQIAVEGIDVPVYNGKVEGDITTDLYILLQQMSAKSKNSMSHIANDVYLTVDIKKRLASSVSSEDVEDVADQILQIVKPTARTIGISIANPFKLIIITVEDNDNERPREVEANNFIVTKSLRFRNHIIQ